MARTIVLTGGPCGGKTAALPRLRAALEEAGLRVFTGEEVATSLMREGLSPAADKPAFQRQVLARTLAREAALREAAAPFGEAAVILLDRGLADPAAYTPPAVYEAHLAEAGLTRVSARDRYDGVFFLQTAAAGRGYTLATNDIRTESPAEALALDEASLAAWVGHPHLRVIPAAPAFETKLARLVAEVKALLGVPEPLETERRFLIRLPGAEALDGLPARTVEIEQTYLRRPDGSRARLRSRGEGEDRIYIETVKRRLTAATRVEQERRLTRGEYEALLAFADPDRRPIVKTRTCFVFEGQYFELDRFPFWEKQAILEIELLREDDPVSLPPFAVVLREITDDPAYTNAALALAVPPED